jgi:hypothetical protein
MDPRTLVRPLGALLVATVIPLAACKKKEEEPAQSGQPGAPGIQINTGPGTGLMAAPESDVQRYSDEGPEIGTTTVRRVAIARKAADQGSEILHRIGPGTAVNKKARKGPYYLVEFPFAPGQLRLGWILQEDANNTTPPSSVAPTASQPAATATVTASAVPSATTGGRPPLIRLKKP